MRAFAYKSGKSDAALLIVLSIDVFSNTRGEFTLQNSSSSYRYANIYRTHHVKF